MIGTKDKNREENIGVIWRKGVVEMKERLKEVKYKGKEIYEKISEKNMRQ